MRAGFVNDPHSEAGSTCPRNFFGHTDYELLRPLEELHSFKRLIQLTRKGITGRFDLAHLGAIHRYLFQDVFPWAGELRVVNMSKGNSNFGPALHIPTALEHAFTKLAREQFLNGLDAKVFADRAAFYLDEINAIHPFREENGRTQREFIRQHAGHPLSWSLEGTGFTQQQMIDASILSHHQAENSALAAILYAAQLSARSLVPGSAVPDFA